MSPKWRFFRAGGVDQVLLTRGAELSALAELDQKLWVALACPVNGLEFDQRTLELLDTDGDGRVRAPDIIAAGRWVNGLLRDPDSLTKGSESLALDQINEDSDEGRAIAATARALLSQDDGTHGPALQTSEVSNALFAFTKRAANGDGIVPPEAVSDAELKAALTDIVASTAEPPVDRSGAKGVSAESAAAFFKELEGYLAWLDAGKAEAVRPLGDATADAYAALAALRGKIEDYFARVRVLAYEPRALELLNPEQAQLASLLAAPLSGSAEELEKLPLARVEVGRALPLKSEVNPAYAKRVEAFSERVVTPCLGPRSALDQAAFETLLERFSAYAAWLAQKPSTKTAALPEERARALGEGALKQRIHALIAADEAERPKAIAFEKVERLVYFHRDLFELANNFVAFKSFYARKGKAAFQHGTLFLDQRECELVLRADDPAKHAVLASLSKCFLVYCDIRRGAEKGSIVAVLSNGESDNVMVGRNGVFYDRKGRDFDATITKIVDNPISVRAAFWAPYKKALRAIENFVNTRAAAAEASADARVSGAVAEAQAATAGKVPAPNKPAKLDIGIVAALGVAVGGITAALGALLQSFFGLGIWMPLGVLGLLLVISGPSMAIAWLKLHQRNLGPLLDANGWAINARARLNVPLGEALTRLPTLPKNASRDLSDPFAERRRPWFVYLLLLILLALAAFWYFGKLDRYLPQAYQKGAILGEAAPPVAP